MIRKRQSHDRGGRIFVWACKGSASSVMLLCSMQCALLPCCCKGASFSFFRSRWKQKLRVALEKNTAQHALIRIADPAEKGRRCTRCGHRLKSRRCTVENCQLGLKTSASCTLKSTLKLGFTFKNTWAQKMQGAWDRTLIAMIKLCLWEAFVAIGLLMRCFPARF